MGAAYAAQDNSISLDNYNPEYPVNPVKKYIIKNSNFDGLVKSYNMPLCDTVTENNLSIISKGYDLVI